MSRVWNHLEQLLCVLDYEQTTCFFFSPDTSGAVVLYLLDIKVLAFFRSNLRISCADKRLVFDLFMVPPTNSPDSYIIA